MEKRRSSPPISSDDPGRRVRAWPASVDIEGLTREDATQHIMLPAGEDPLPGGSNLPDPCPKKCKYCLQRLDVVESVPVEDYVAGKEPKSERQAVRDPTLAVMGLVSVFGNNKIRDSRVFWNIYFTYYQCWRFLGRLR